MEWNSQEELCISWWAVLGAKSNQTFAIAQLLLSPLKAREPVLPPLPIPIRKRDRIKSILCGRKPAVTGTVSGNYDSVVVLLPPQGSSVSINANTICYSAMAKCFEIPSPAPGYPFKVGPGKATTLVSAIMVLTAFPATEFANIELAI